jgi:predicted metal-dependent HD superfamily phosphohydrolase
MKLYDLPPGIKYLHSWFVELIQREYYNATPRSYHGPQHLVDLFTFARDHKMDLTPAEELALVMHDAIYVPGASSNEAASVHLMHSLVGYYENKCFTFSAGADQYNEILSAAGSMIISTRDHQLGHPNNGASAARVIDLDLYGLSDAAYLQKSTELVWNEYKGTMISSTRGDVKQARFDFNAGRIDWIAKFLKRKTIYMTREFLTLYEDKARENLREEASRLMDVNSKSKSEQQL